MARTGSFIFDIVKDEQNSTYSSRCLIVLETTSTSILARPVDGSDSVEYRPEDEGIEFFLTKNNCLQECYRRNSENL